MTDPIAIPRRAPVPSPAASEFARRLVSGEHLHRTARGYVFGPPASQPDPAPASRPVIFGKPTRSAPIVDVPLIFPVSIRGEPFKSLQLRPPSLAALRRARDDGFGTADAIVAALAGLAPEIVAELAWVDVEALLEAGRPLLPPGFVLDAADLVAADPAIEAEAEAVAESAAAVDSPDLAPGAAPEPVAVPVVDGGADAT